MRITKEQARRYLVSLHFENEAAAKLSPIEQVVYHTRRLGCIQYDPLDVVGRNPELVLQSRIKKYKPEYLYRALYESRELIDGFDKNLAIYPLEDYPYFQRMREQMVRNFRENETIAASFERTLQQVEARGPLCSDHLDYAEKVRWPWGATNLAKASLESLWMDGRLVLHHRKGARRYFDLSGRHIPEEILSAGDPNATREEYYLWHLRRRIGSVGLLWNRASDAFLGIDGFKIREREAAFSALGEAGELVEIEIDGIDRPLYLRKRDEDTLARALNAPVSETARIIAPLDNFIWDRKLIEALFGFEYRWEVYVPKEKRKYGYYVLPVLYGDNFVARFEPEHFRGGQFTILNWWWEEGVKPTKKMRKAIETCLNKFCTYLGADSFTIQTGFE